MQKNLPKYTPEWVRDVSVWAEASKRDVSYALCNDRRTLLWFGNQRAVEYHPALALADRLDHITHLVLDLDPPGDDVQRRRCRRQARTRGARRRRAVGSGQDQRRQGAARVRPDRGDDQRTTRLPPPARWRNGRHSSTRRSPPLLFSRRIAAARSSSMPPARVAPPWSPPTARVPAQMCRCRFRSGGTTSTISPRDFTIKNAVASSPGSDPWAEAMPPDQRPTAGPARRGSRDPDPRVAAMHEGKRRKAKQQET